MPYEFIRAVLALETLRPFLGWPCRARLSASGRGIIGAAADDELRSLLAMGSKVAHFPALEVELATIATIMPNFATIYDYVRTLVGVQILPPQVLNPRMHHVVQQEFRGNLPQPWFSYTLSHLQHNDFEGFADHDLLADRRYLSPTIFQVIEHLVECAVADEECINVVGRWSWQLRSEDLS